MIRTRGDRRPWSSSSVRRVLVHAALVTGGLSCAITDPCACPPAVTSFLLYGETPAAGQPGARSTAVVRENYSAGCADPASPSLIVSDPVSIAADGSYRAVLLSAHAPGPRCLRVAFYAGAPGLSDSLVVTTAAVSFTLGAAPTDSLRLDLP